MLNTLRKFGLQYCDLETMLWNVSVMLRVLTLNIDERNKKPIPIFVYVVAVSICLSYFYVYLVSMSWFVFCRCPATGDLLAAIIVFSLGISSEIGTVKLLYMFLHIGQVRQIVSECLACDASVVAGSRFSNNLLKTLRQVKKRAMVFWVVIIGNGVVYIMKPVILPGRHFTEDKFVLYVDELMRKWRNVRDYYIKEKRKAVKSTSPEAKKKKKKKYNYYDCLSFLDVVIKEKRKANYSSSEEIKNNTEEYLEDTHTDDMISDEQCPDYDEDSNESNFSVDIKQEEEAISYGPMPSFMRRNMRLPTHIIAPSNNSQDVDNVTANKNFLLSLLPDVTSLNESQNMRFRIGVLNLLNDIKFEIKNESITPS